MCRCFIIPPYMLKSMIAHADSLGSAPMAPGASAGDRADVPLASAHIQATLDDTNSKRAAFQAEGSGNRRVAAAMFMMPRCILMRAVHSANNGLSLPGVLMRSENQPPVPDPAVNELYDTIGDVYTFFRDMWARHSIDDRGMIIEAVAHYGLLYDNAYWEGGRLVCGDGDNIYFNRFTGDPAVIAHELVHGLTQCEAGIIYKGRKGVANESISDSFAIAFDHYHKRKVFSDADWVIGTKILKQGLQGRGIRDLREPGTAFNDPRLGRDMQPAHMKHYIEAGEIDEMHLNSGIPNKAFYLVCEQLKMPSWHDPIRIWYRALCEYATKDTDVETWPDCTARAAIDLFSAGSGAYQAVRRAWNAVGLSVKT
jgi:Zn-dependent metalloprotease